MPEIKACIMHSKSVMQSHPDQQDGEEKNKDSQIFWQNRDLAMGPQITDAKADDSKTQQVKTNCAFHQMINLFPKRGKELLGLMFIHPPGSSANQANIHTQCAEHPDGQRLSGTDQQDKRKTDQHTHNKRAKQAIAIQQNPAQPSALGRHDIHEPDTSGFNMARRRSVRRSIKSIHQKECDGRAWGCTAAASIHMASPYEKKRYSWAIASAYSVNNLVRPIRALTNRSKELLGK